MNFEMRGLSLSLSLSVCKYEAHFSSTYKAKLKTYLQTVLTVFIKVC